MVTEVALNRVQAALSEMRAARASAETATRVESTRSADARLKAFTSNGPETIPPIEAGALASAVEEIQLNVQNLQRSLRFSVDEASGRTVITVVDKETDKVIRQIPPAEVIAIARRIEDAVGLFVEDEA